MTDPIQFQEEMQDAFSKYYDHSNYPTTVTNELMDVLHNKYDNNLASFKEIFVKPTQKLLETLQQNRMPLYVKQDQTVKIIVHLALLKTVQTGEFFFCVGHTNPGTLTVKFCKYVTQLENGTNLAEPKYGTVKMTVEENSHNECLTLDYFEDLRENGEQKGTERTSVMFRLCWVKVLNQNLVGGLLKLYDAHKILSHKKQKNKLEKSLSSPVPIQPANIQRFHKPQQVSDDSFRSLHPLEEALLPPSKITRQRAYDRPVTSDLVESNQPQMEWQEDPTGMGGSYVPSSSDNLNTQTYQGTNAEIASDIAVASKPPVNEWKSQNTDSGSGESLDCSSLRSTASGNIHVSTAFGSSGPEALLQITEGLESSAQKKGKDESRPMQRAREVRNEYIKGMESVGPALASSFPAGRTCNKLAKNVNNGYVGKSKGIGPIGTCEVHLMAEGNNPRPANDVNSDKHASSVPSGASSSVGGVKDKPANDVNDGYVGRFKGMDPSSASSSMAQATEKSGGRAKDVIDGYVPELKAIGPSK